MQILITHTSHSTDQHILRQFCLFVLCPFPPLFSFPSLLCFSHLPFFKFSFTTSLSSASHPVFPSFSLPLLSLSLSGVFPLLLLLFFYSYTFSAVTLSLIENALLQSFNIPAGNTHTHTQTMELDCAVVFPSRCLPGNRAYPHSVYFPLVPFFLLARAADRI